MNGIRPDVPLHTIEQPIASARIIFDPNSCVSIFTYSVSPQPAHAPLNSIIGGWNCEPLTVLLSTRWPLFVSVIANSQFFASTSRTALSGFIVSDCVGHTFAHTSQPVQSSGDIWMRKFRPFSSSPAAGSVAKLAGAFLLSAASSRNGRITACGHISAHWLHCVQVSLFHTGTFTAKPRFSYCEVLVSCTPPGVKVDTGNLSPSSSVVG